MSILAFKRSGLVQFAFNAQAITPATAGGQVAKLTL